ncbi:MAG: hypothetical protein HY928_08555 [Elusimicrobia bacterium]|nr:hypothetical protein [Elusimicrobiota bacterium]
MTISLLLPALLSLSGTASAAAPAPEAAATAVDASSAAAKPLTVDDIYGGAKFRDPFMKLGGAGVAAAPSTVKEYDPENFTIHSLELKGLMRDKKGYTALLFDASTATSFVLKGGRVYDPKKKPVPGITGTIKMEQKTVTLMTADKDVQTLRLGETAGEAEE